MLRFAANLGCLFVDRPILERFAAARDAGFTAVEFHGPESASAVEIAAAASTAGVEIVLCNAPVGDLLPGGRGLAGVPGREGKFREAIDWAAEFAVVTGCRAVNIGPSRIASESDRRSSLITLAENLRYAGNMLGEHAIKAFVEPLNTNDFAGVLLSTADEALSAIRASGAGNVFLQFDLYHMHQMHTDALAVLEAHVADIGHIQFADVPGRGPPGTGTIDFEEFFATVDQLGYTGWLGVEYRSTERTEHTLGWFDRVGRGGTLDDSR